jgi:chromate transporter
MNIYFQLFYEFLKTGLFSVGGGLATLPFLYDIADKTGWFTHTQLTDLIAVSESTPGPIGINVATYAGFITKGIPGAIVATVGLIIPALVIVIVIAKFLNDFKDNCYVQAVFYGLRPASTGLIAGAGIMVVNLSLLHLDAFAASGSPLDLFNWRGILLAAAIYLASKKFKSLHPVVLIAISAVVGIVFRFAGV